MKNNMDLWNDPDYGIEDIDYFLSKAEDAKKHLRSYLTHYNLGSDYEPGFYMVTKEIQDLVSIQNQCTRLKAECIRLKIVLDNHVKSLQ